MRKMRTLRLIEHSQVIFPGLPIHIISIPSQRKGKREERNFWKTGRWGGWREDPNVGPIVGTLKYPSIEHPSSLRKTSLRRDEEEPHNTHSL